jgi:3'-5' exoribonuclease
MLSQHDKGEKITIYGAVESISEKESKAKKPYIILTLATEGKMVKCFRWGTTKSRLGVKTRDVVKADGTVDEYNGTKSLIIDKIAVVKKPSQELLRQILPGLSKEDQKLYERTIKKYIAAVDDPEYREIVMAVLNTFWKDFKKAPAASRNHDAFVGGLMKHTMYVVVVACSIAKTYGGMIDKNLLIAGALLHDLGKIRTYDVGLSSIAYSTQGTLLDHVFHTISMIDEALRAKGVEADPEKLMLIKHIVVSHHGQRDWGAVNEPSFPEAMIVHLADMVDCHVSMMDAALRDTEPGNLTDEKVWPYVRKLYRRAESE